MFALTVASGTGPVDHPRWRYHDPLTRLPGYRRRLRGLFLFDTPAAATAALCVAGRRR